MDVTFLMTSRVDPIAFGARLKQTRMSFKLTQTRLAEEIGASKSFICLCEAGKVKEVSGSLLLLMAKRMRVKPDWLLFGECL